MSGYQTMTPYVPVADFSLDEAAQLGGRSTVDTSKLDTEFAALVTTTDQLQNNLLCIQRTDGFLEDRIVKTFNLSTEVMALISASANHRGPWATATAYAVGDVVSQNNIAYMASEAHTSGVFATDLTADRWSQISAITRGSSPDPDLITDGQFHIVTASAGVIDAHADADELVIEGSGHTGITIISGNASNSSVVFADDGNALEGSIGYTHSVSRMTLSTGGGVERLRLSSIEASFNDVGGDTDFRIKSDNNASKFFMNAGTDLVQVAMGRAPTALATVGGALSIEIESVGSAANTSEQDLMTYTLPADSLNTNGDYVRISFAITFAANVALKTYRLYFGSLAMVAYTTVTPTDDAGGSLWGKVLVQRSALDTQLVYTEHLGISTLPSGGVPGAFTTGTEDDGAAIVIRLTGQSAGGTLDDILALKLQVEMGESP